MIVLMANKDQRETLEGVYGCNSELRFVLDGAGNYIVGLEVLSDPEFEEIKEQLEALERIEYTPKIIKE